MKALQTNRARTNVPVLVVADKTVSKAPRERLYGYLAQVVRQGSFAPEQRLIEVRRALRGKR